MPSAPAPTSDCDACDQPGWYAEAALLYMTSYSGNNLLLGGLGGGNGYDGDWDLGARVAVGNELPDGLFYEVSGFWYEGDFSVDTEPGELEVYYIDAIIGDNLHCGEACLDYGFGLRYADAEVTIDGDSGGFDGIGPVLELSGKRPLTEQLGVYAEMRQAILFGDLDFDGTSVDTVASVTELGGGVEFFFNAGPVQNAWARLGVEGQYWAVDDLTIGLVGGVLKVGFNF
ncbi:MAG: hypothetical protein HKN82_06065 [Akkermansiaceae bacterium]|nr:hypothetical protein [Akkermansiaceae bacterium]